MKSKVITLPAGTTVTLWREDSQMCVGLKAPGLDKGTRLGTKLTGEAGEKLSTYMQYLRLVPVIEELKDAGIDFFDYDVEGGSFRWGSGHNEIVLDFCFDGSVLDISNARGVIADPYLVATLLRRVIDTYDVTITKVDHNDTVVGALLALSYQPKIVINTQTQQAEKGDEGFRLVQVEGQLGFIVGPIISLHGIQFATECATALGRPEATIILADDSLSELPQSMDVSFYVRGYMNFGNCIWVSTKGDELTIYGTDEVVYTATADGTVLKAVQAGEDVTEFGIDHQLIAYVVSALGGSSAQGAQSTEQAGPDLALWISKLRQDGVRDPEEAVRVLVAQGLI